MLMAFSNTHDIDLNALCQMVVFRVEISEEKNKRRNEK
jgi:hypothetical protein